MFGRFFKNKDENASKSLPPGHRPSQIGGGSGGDAVGGAAPAEPMGGGFFNLQPTLVKGPPSYGQPATNGAAPLPSSAAPGQGGFSRPTSGGPHHGVPSYGAPQVPQYGQPQPPPSGGMDMFGGMSLKAPPAATSASHAGAAAPSGYGGASLRPSPIKYGGYGGTQAPSHVAAPPMPASSGSLFSGLDLVPGGAPTGGQAPAAPSMSYNHDGGEITRPVMRKASGSGGRSGSFHSTASSGGVDAPPAHRPSVGPGIGATTPATRVGGAKTVKKKKTKSFRPGFGRQLSDESVAALQRGDLNQDDVIQQHHHVDEQEKAPPRMATNATDLAHLLPPVRNGSVLAGLTVHDSGAASSNTSGGSVLAGLTVHGGGSTAAAVAGAAAVASPRSSQSADAGGLLAGLSVHGKSSEQPDASMSVVLPSKKKTPAPPAEPEKPAAPPTPEEKLMNTLRDFHASAVSFRNSALKQNEEENRILERKVQLAKQLTQYEIDLRTIEAQQQQACEVEDFEKADALNATINSVRHCITLSESDVRKVDSELTAFVKAKEKAFTNQLRSTRGTLKELEKFREDQDAERSVLRDELTKYEVEQSEHLQFEAERIDTELHHVSSNMDHLTSEKSEIEGTIEEQCKSEISLREELLVEKAGVEDEIRELERQLRIKMEQLQTIESSISKAEKDINLVRSKYSRQLKRIADREDGLLKTKHEVEADAEHLKEKKKQFTASIHDYESRIAAFGKRMAAVKKEMRAATLLAAVLEVQETRRDQAIVRKKQHTAELTALADSAAIAEQSFVMLRKQHDDLEKSLSLHHNAIASAESMIPKLEQEKKAAAAQRNFKEAARISKDIKTLEKDQAIAEEMVEVVEMELQDLKERIGKRETEYEEKKDELKVVEKQLELNTLNELWKEAKHLRKSLRKFEKLKSEGIAAADGVDFRASALLLVQAEYEGCMMEAEALEAKYDVTDPSQDEEDDEEDDDDDDDESVDEDEVERLTEVGGFHGAGDADAAGAGGVVQGGRESELAAADSPAALEELASKIVELEEMIEQATENEEYELAAKLDEKIDVLRRRQHSLHALSVATSESNAQPESTHYQGHEDEDESNAYEQQEDDEDGQEGDEDEGIEEGDEEEEDEGGNSPEELENELRLVLARIKMLEADIERATDNEDYETAAELEEEMQQMREEEAAIAELLAESRTPISENEQPIPVSSPVAQETTTTTTTSSLFEGLGFKTVAPEDPTPEEPVSSETTSSLFAGLQLGASPDEDAAPIERAVQAVEEVVEAMSVEPAASPKSDVQAAVVSPKDLATSPRRLSTGSGSNSPRRKSSLSMCSGLQVGAVAEEEARRKSSAGSSSSETIATSAAMVDGLQLGTSSSFSVQEEEESTTASATSSASGMMFEGLQLGSSVESVAVVAAGSAVSSSDSLFGGLMVASRDQGVDVEEEEQRQEDEATSEDGVVVDAADATEPSSENMSSMFGGLSVKSGDMTAEDNENAEVSTTTTTATPDAAVSSETGVTVAVAATTTTATASSEDMFGGLSLASSAPPVVITTTSVVADAAHE